MAGKFTNTSYTKMVDSLIQASKGVLRNPYYLYSDKKPTKVTYYKQNLEKTTLDPASGLNYTHIGQQSPIKFNKITDFYLYGIDQITRSLDIGDFGLENDAIDGTCVVLPNTIIPTMGDYFKIDQVKEDILFRVNAVNMDTLDNGSNAFEINYKLEKTKATKDIENQVVAQYKCIMANVGTDFKCIIEEGTLDIIGKLEGLLGQMTDAYQLFFNPKVQNFLYTRNGSHMYDPYLIEFMIRNKIMSYGEDYIFVHQGCAIPNTFGYEYSKTIWFLLENPDQLERRPYYNLATATKVTDINSLFTTVLYPIYALNYNDPNCLNSKFEVIDGEVLSRCRSGEYLEDDFGYRRAWNLMIAYFKQDFDYIQTNLVEFVQYIDYTENQDFFYLIPIIIFIIKALIGNLMENN